MFGTYDYSGSWEDDLWRFGDPVSLIFLSRRSMTAATIESVLRNQLGFNATAAIADEGGLAVAYDDLADATRMSVWCGFPQGNRLQPDPADEDSFFHVRVYAYNGIWWHRRSSDPYMVVATCHVDVNEAMDDAGPEKVPSGFPVPRLPKYAYYRFAGNSESVEDYIADRWAEEFGEANVSRDTVWLGNSENAFTVTREALVSGPTGATGYAAYATWWKCDGYATVLRWP
jgi:hypothetical protein